MKFVTAWLLTAILAACAPREQVRPGLSGAIDNHEGVLLELTYFEEYFNNNRVVMAIEPGPDGAFHLPLDLPGAVSAGLRIGRLEVPLYLRPGDETFVAFDALMPLESMAFSGEGGANNNVMLTFYKEVDMPMGNRFMMTEAGRRGPDEFVALSDSLAAIKTAFLQASVDDGQPTEDFMDYMETRIRYERLTSLLDYTVMHQRATGSASPPELPNGYDGFLQADGIFDDARLEHLSYVNFLMAYLNHFMRQKAAEPSHEELSMNTMIFAVAEEALEGKSRDYIQAMMVGRELSYGRMEDAELVYQQFTGGSAHDTFINRVQSIYNAMQALTAGNPAPAFTMTDMAGREVSLEDFRGKVVFMDFWASWCGPCMREMPHIKAMKERFAGEEDLVFIYVSIDTDVDAWLSAVERLDLEGVHFNTPGRERGVPALFQVKWIPTFYVIGRDGNIFDHRPPMPSQGGLDEVILAALSYER